MFSFSQVGIFSGLSIWGFVIVCVHIYVHLRTFQAPVDCGMLIYCSVASPIGNCVIILVCVQQIKRKRNMCDSFNNQMILHNSLSDSAVF